jgi:hypothetical protein
MNWIWEDDISAITIDRNIPCIEASIRVKYDSHEHREEYLHELRKSIRRFREIYDDLSLMIIYLNDGNQTIETEDQFLNDFLSIVSAASCQKVALVNVGSYHPAVLQICQVFSGQHFNKKDDAIRWLKS